MSIESRNVPIELNEKVYIVQPNGDITREAGEAIPHWNELDHVRCHAADIYTMEKRTELNDSEFEYWKYVKQSYSKEYYGVFR